MAQRSVSYSKAKSLSTLRTLRSRSGSALVSTMVMVAILGISVSSILYSARESTRRTRDKLEYEMAYQAALSGVHMGRAVLNSPALLVSMMGRANLQNDVEGLLQGVGKTTENLVKGNLLGAVTNLTGSVNGVLGNHGLGSVAKVLPDGRIVLIDIPLGDKGVMGFVNDRDDKYFTESLYNHGSRANCDYWVENLRFTTGPVLKGVVNPSNGNVDLHSLLNSDSQLDLLGLKVKGLLNLSLSDVCIIIESRGICNISGRKKERVIQERVLVYPQVDEIPVIGATASLLAGGDIKAAANLDVAWGPVTAAGDIELPKLEISQKRDYLFGIIPIMTNTINIKALTGFRGAGMNRPDITGVEKWVKYQSGSELVTKEVQTFSLLGDLLGLVGNVLSTVLNLTGDLLTAALTGSLDKNLEFAGFVNDVNGNKYKNNGHNYGLFKKENNQVSDGALVQKSESTTNRVNQFLNGSVFDGTMNYADLKLAAIRANGYAKPSANGYVNELGVPLYITPNGSLTIENEAGNVRFSAFSDILRISNPVRNKLASISGYVHSRDMDDKLLFIDNAAGQETVSTTFDNQLVIPSDFFWKGVLYINGNVRINNGNAATIVQAKNPEQYAANPTGDSPSVQLKRVVLDGILMATGTVERSGNAVIYGSIMSKGGQKDSQTEQSNVDLIGKVFFNSANGTGRLQKPLLGAVDVRVVVGRIYEADRWLDGKPLLGLGIGGL